MSKLWRVTVEHEYFVTADDEFAAERIARENCSSALRDFDDRDVWVSEVSELKTVPNEWRDSLPYGGDDDLTCEQILAPRT